MKVSVDVFAGLSDTECRRAGNWHNQQTDTLDLSFTAMVKQARRLLYQMAELSDDDEPPKEVPKGFREAFQRELCMEQKVISARTPDVYKT